MKWKKAKEKTGGDPEMAVFLYFRAIF